MKLRWKAVRGTKSYFVECATSGTKYWFRVRAFGTAGFSGWSDPAQKMAA